MDTLAKRLKFSLEKANMSQAALARRVGVSRGAVSLWLSGTTKEISMDNLIEVASALGVSPVWLAQGYEPESEPPETAALSTLGDKGSVYVWDHPDDLPPDDGRVWVDRWDYSVSAGDGMLQWEIRQKKALPFTGEFFKAIGCKPENCKLVTVRGDSMEPFLFDRDMIMVDTTRTEPKDGGIYAVIFEGEALVKQIFKEPGGALILHSYNDRYRDKRIEPNVNVQFAVVGEVKYRSGAGFVN